MPPRASTTSAAGHARGSPPTWRRSATAGTTAATSAATSSAACRRSSGRAASPGSASRSSTAGSACPSNISACFLGGVGALRHAVLAQRADARHPRRHAGRVRHARTEGAPPAGDPAWRGAVGAVPVRALGRVRSGWLSHPSGSRRRRVPVERLQNLEFGRVRERLRDVPRPHQLGCAQAPRPHHVHPEDPSARRHGRADPPGGRHARVLPGVLRRRGDAPRRRGGRGRRRLECGLAAADPRADGRRRRLAVHQRALDRPRQRRGRHQRDRHRPGHRARRRPPRAVNSWPRRTCANSWAAISCAASPRA